MRVRDALSLERGGDGIAEAVQAASEDVGVQTNRTALDRYIDLVRDFRASTTFYLGRIKDWSVSDPLPVGEGLFVRLFLDESRKTGTHDALAAHWLRSPSKVHLTDASQVAAGLPGVLAVEHLSIHDLPDLPASRSEAGPAREGLAPHAADLAMRNLVLLEQTVRAANGL